jgi:hypothetical protein
MDRYGDIPLAPSGPRGIPPSPIPLIREGMVGTLVPFNVCGKDIGGPIEDSIVPFGPIAGLFRFSRPGWAPGGKPVLKRNRFTSSQMIK